MLQGLQRVHFLSLKVYMHLLDRVLYINICLLFCVFGEPMWICHGTQGPIQQQTGDNSTQSLCLTGGFAPTVSFVHTNTLYHIQACQLHEYLIGRWYLLSPHSADSKFQ